MSVVLSCRECSAEHRWSDDRMLSELQRRGSLRREKRPAADVLRELLTACSASLVCPDCGVTGLIVGDDWSDDWGVEVKCDGCGVGIPAERLEVFPEAKLCRDCQSKQDSGSLVAGEPEYCRKCGGLLQVKPKGGGGIAGYRLVCGDCGAVE